MNKQSDRTVVFIFKMVSAEFLKFCKTHMKVTKKDNTNYYAKVIY